MIVCLLLVLQVASAVAVPLVDCCGALNDCCASNDSTDSCVTCACATDRLVASVGGVPSISPSDWTDVDLPDVSAVLPAGVLQGIFHVPKPSLG